MCLDKDGFVGLGWVCVIELFFPFFFLSPMG